MCDGFSLEAEYILCRNCRSFSLDHRISVTKLSLCGLYIQILKYFILIFIWISIGEIETLAYIVSFYYVVCVEGKAYYDATYKIGHALQIRTLL